MKKICFITTTYVTLNSFVLETAQSLHNSGDYDITFICADNAEFRNSLPEYINFVPVNMKRGIDFRGIFNVFKLIKIFKKYEFDMVQYATPNASLYASIAAKFTDIPIRLYCQWGIRYVGMSGLFRKIFKRIEKYVCSLSTDIRSVSKKNEHFSIQEGLYEIDKSFLVGIGGTIGVDTEYYDFENKEKYSKEYRKKLGFKDEDFVIGFVGRASRDKGSNELLSVFKELSAQNSSLKLLLIGTIEPQNGLDVKLLNWAEQSDKVVLTGPIENRYLKYYYAALDCYVHPSYREGFGLAIQEAAAMRDAIITTNIPGASEVMQEDISCLLCEPKDTESLKQALIKLIDDRKLCDFLADNARKRCEEFFDRKYMLSLQTQYYNKLLNEWS